MAIIKYALIILAAPLVVLVCVALVPLALFFSLVRIPFARRRIKQLNKLIPDNWLSRKKYIYICYSSHHELAKFIEEEIIPKYKKHIIYDKWSEPDSEWLANEPDTYHRVTTILQDIAGEFDGDPHALVAVLSPDNTTLSTKSGNIIFYTGDDKEIFVGNSCPEPISKSDAKNRITKLVESSMSKWSRSDTGAAV